MATEYKNVETIFQKVLDPVNTLVKMTDIKNLFHQATDRVFQYFGDLQRAKLHYFPLVDKHYQLNKKSKDNPKGIELTKYDFIGDILKLEETQVKVYNKAYQIQVQFPDVDWSKPIDSIVKQYETVKGADGKSVKLDNGMFKYQLKEENKPEVDANGEPIQLSNTEVLQRQIDAKKAAIVKAENRVKTLQKELEELNTQLAEEIAAEKRYQKGLEAAGKTAKKAEKAAAVELQTV